ncbi:MAG: TlpA disulfide reductase family protein [Actinomycetota bacterium]|nr:TlpA disulfide reductase family protein [Actinomycetota bacterium]
MLPRLGAPGNVSLASLHGRPVVVNLFASWCTVCASELPVFAQDARALRGEVNVVEDNALETVVARPLLSATCPASGRHFSPSLFSSTGSPRSWPGSAGTARRSPRPLPPVLAVLGVLLVLNRLARVTTLVQPVG